MKKILLFVLLLMGVAVTAQVANTPPDLNLCDQGTIDGIETFDLTANDAPILGGQNPADFTVTYHLSVIDAQNNTNALPTNYVNISNPQTVYVRVTETATGNYDATSFNLNVVTAPNAFPFTNPLISCDIDNDTFGFFDLTTIVSDLTGGISGVDVGFFETEAEADQGVGAIDISVIYENIDTDGDGIGETQTIYAVLSVNGLDCTTIVPVNLLVIDSPVLPSDSLIYAQCEETPNITDGLLVFDLVSYEQYFLYEEIIVAAGGDVTVTNQYTATYYTQLDAFENPDPASIIGVPNAFENQTTPDQVIYVEVTHTGWDTVPGTGCSTVKEITLHVALLPTANYTSIEVCDDTDGATIPDGIVVFNLEDYNANITGGATDVDVSFYLSQADAEAGIGTGFISDPTAYTNTVNPQIIFARVYSLTTECYAIAIVNLHVNPDPTPLSTADIAATLGNNGVMEECDGNVDGTGAIAEQQAIFDVTHWEPVILNGEIGVSTSYYNSYDDAEVGINQFANPTTYTNISNPQTIYIRVTNDGTGIFPPTNGTGCYTIVEFQIYVPVPEVTVTGDTTLVIDENGNPISDVLLTATAGPSNPAAYDYQWALNGVDIPLATGMTYVVTEGGEYTVTVSGPIDFDCINTATHVVDVVTIPQDNLTVETISESCVGLDNGMIQITANEAYTYEVSMSLNGNAITVSPNTFTDVISIPNLASGTYYVCVTATEVNATQCYDVYVEAVENLVGFSGRMGNTYTLELKGSKYYNVAVNGVVTEITAVTTTEVVTFEYELSAEVTTVTVITDKECQGRFEETVLLDAAKLIMYPNPAVNEIRFSINTELSSVVVYDISGKVVLDKKAMNNNSINVAELDAGWYFVKAISGANVFTSKFIKK